MSHVCLTWPQRVKAGTNIYPKSISCFLFNMSEHVVITACGRWSNSYFRWNIFKFNFDLTGWIEKMSWSTNRVISSSSVYQIIKKSVYKLIIGLAYNSLDVKIVSDLQIFTSSQQHKIFVLCNVTTYIIKPRFGFSFSVLFTMSNLFETIVYKRKTHPLIIRNIWICLIWIFNGFINLVTSQIRLLINSVI